MKKFLLFLRSHSNFLEKKDSYVCKVNTSNCKYSVTVLASNLKDAKKDALDFFMNSYSCKKISQKDISCKRVSLATGKELEVDDAPADMAKEKKALKVEVMPIKSFPKNMKVRAKAKNGAIKGRRLFNSNMVMPEPTIAQTRVFNTEEYAHIKENNFKEVKTSPLSTFSTDVDTASYANTRRYLSVNNQLPPKGAVRIEELLNYFSYDYKQPKSKYPFEINTRVGETFWNKNSKIIQIGLQTKKPNIAKLPPSNLVFLLDVSGSMSDPNKLPLLKKSLKLLVKQLRPVDRVSIVVYAGAAGLVLDRARGDEREKIIKALDRLNAGGSTAGGAGIKLAYKVALKAFIKGGNNRVIIATDGDFNVGQSSESALVDMIEKKRKSGVFLTVLGFGMGNYKDSKMEKLADKGNGNYAYIDNLLEAKKVLVTQMSGTLYTVAKDVKVQVEFNPALVYSYRLIGYENRALANEDFNDDKKDAAEIGMGHRVTAMYEIILQGKQNKPKVDKLKYQTTKMTDSANSKELATVKIRYKKPDGKISTRMSKAIIMSDSDISDSDFNFAQSVAGFAMLLTNSKYKGQIKFVDIIKLAKSSKGKDSEGYRAEFIKMVEKAELIK